MSLSPRPHHPLATPFSVTDILHHPASALDPDFKKTVESIPPLGHAYHHRSPPHPQSAMGSMGGMSAMGAGNPYANYVNQFSHHTPSFPAAQYCNGSDLSAYADPRHSSAGWYGGATDARFSCEYFVYAFLRCFPFKKRKYCYVPCINTSLKMKKTKNI